MQQNGELSVEEILESIKKVIARDNREVAQTARVRRSAIGAGLSESGNVISLVPASAPEPRESESDALELGEAEILELGDALPEDSANEDAAESLDDDALPEDDTAEDSAPEDMIVAEAVVEDEPVAQAPAEPESEIVAEAPVVAEPAGSTQEIDLETMTLDNPATDTGNGDDLIERLTKEMLQPMIAQWVDANLPRMVEQLVKAKVARKLGGGAR